MPVDEGGGVFAESLGMMGVEMGEDVKRGEEGIKLCRIICPPDKNVRAQVQSVGVRRWDLPRQGPCRPEQRQDTEEQHKHKEQNIF